MDQTVLRMLEKQTKNIEKLQYQISLLKGCIDYTGHEIDELILSYDWDKEKIEKVHDIFGQYRTILEQYQTFNVHDFEHELKNKCDIDYQIVKSIMRAFYHSGNWISVCTYFVKIMKDTAIEYDSLYNEMVRRGDIKE